MSNSCMGRRRARFADYGLREPALAGRADHDVCSSRYGGNAARPSGQRRVRGANPGKTGIHAFPDPYDAFAARVVLAAATEKSLDVQYYIWHGDQVGYLLFEALWQAAERGARATVARRLQQRRGLDPTIAAIDAHPNIGRLVPSTSTRARRC